MNMKNFPLEEGRQYLLNVGIEGHPVYIVGIWVGYRFISLESPDGGDQLNESVVLEYLPL